LELPTAVPSRVPRILLADDQPDILEALQLLLKTEGFQVQSVSSPAAVLAAVEDADFDAALIDLNYARDTTSGQEGLDLLGRLQAGDPTLPVIVLTAWASVEVAVEAMRRGARDFVQKPWDNARLLAIIRTQVELSRALRRGRQLEGAARLSFDGAAPLIARSPAMRPVIELIERTAPSDANVLITGENGTGKGLIAQAIHALSPRASRPMVTVNAGGVSETVFESELFGHVRGAFTDARSDRVGRFELADGGTLFLDEIANVPASQQAKLLRVIASGEFERLGSSRTRRVDVRVLSATNAEIDAEVAAGRFRQDLLFRLNTIEIVLPPLRDRRDDIPALAAHFLEQHARRYRKKVTNFDQAAMDALMRHPWPGNVRELEHAIERSVLMATAAVVTVADLGLRRSADGAQSLENMGLEDVEAFLIRKAVTRYGSVTEAAKALGLSRSALYRRLERFGIEP
jgi:DNA-binding NtrC family response regulator